MSVLGVERPEWVGFDEALQLAEFVVAACTEAGHPEVTYTISLFGDVDILAPPDVHPIVRRAGALIRSRYDFAP